MTLTLDTYDLETGAHIARDVGKPFTNFGVSRTFRSRHQANLSDASCDRHLATLTFDLEGHGACC